MTTDILMCGQTKHHEQRAIRNELNLVFVQITFRRAPVTDFDRAGRASTPPSASATTVSPLLALPLLVNRVKLILPPNYSKSKAYTLYSKVIRNIIMRNYRLMKILPIPVFRCFCL